MKNSATIIPVSLTDCQVISWKSTLKSAISESSQLLRYLDIEHSFERECSIQPNFPVRVPLPFAEKMEKGNINDPLLLQVLAQDIENLKVQGFSHDPLQEQQNALPGLIHKYSGRVLLLLSGSCAINCRYCFRRHFPYNQQIASGKNLTNILNYIQDNPSITEIILSGGDPLLIGDEQLSKIITQLEKIAQLKRLRIHTRLPVVIPQRLTERLRRRLSKSRLQTSIVIHANHPNEIDDKIGLALNSFVRSGTSVFNQSVLLKKVNDDELTLAQLSEKLFEYQIVPYYIHLLDPVAGASHFEVSKEEALKILNRLKNILPGYLVPKLVYEEPYACSKTTLC